jgi:glyoxylase-like metal-dependent hydrolase (beta-lactamase superfamily II)
MMSPRTLVLAPLCAAALAVTLNAQQARPASARAAEKAAPQMRIMPLRGNIYVITGDGGNVTVSLGKDGVLLVDAGEESKVDQLLDTIRALDRQVTGSGRPMQSCVGVVQGCTWWNGSSLMPSTVAPPAPKAIAGIVNTSLDADHVGGNTTISAAGKTYGTTLGAQAATPAWIVGHENVALRLTQAQSKATVPSDTYYGDDKKLNFFNGEGIVVAHVDAAHTDGDSMVYFRGSDVIAAGDLFNMAYYPVIETANGGSITGIVAAANKLLDMIVWEHMMEGGTIIVPGHGRIADVADVAYYRDMVTIMRDRVAVLKKEGKTLAQVKAAKVTRDYDPRWGRNPQWTPDMFVEAIFNTLKAGE